MNLLWIINSRSPGSGWASYPLETGLVQLTPDGPVPLPIPIGWGGMAGPLLVESRVGQDTEQWLLLSTPGNRVSVNGSPVSIGARLLRDRDAISLGNGKMFFFSAERIAQVEPYPGKDDHTCCVRCKLPLEPAAPVVRCPAPDCGFFHHQSKDRPCWTYAEGCANCGHPTSFEAGYQWSPAEL